MTPSLAIMVLWLLFGFAAGCAHFALLRWNAGLYVGGGSLQLALAVQAVRLAATTALLVFAAWHGAAALLVATAGVLVARAIVLRRTAAVS